MTNEESPARFPDAPDHPIITVGNSVPRWTDADLSLACELAYEAGRAAGIREAGRAFDTALDGALGGPHSYGLSAPLTGSAREVVHRFYRAVGKQAWPDRGEVAA